MIVLGDDEQILTCNFHSRASGLVVSEETGVDGIDLLEIVHVLQEDLIFKPISRMCWINPY